MDDIQALATALGLDDVHMLPLGLARAVATWSGPGLLKYSDFKTGEKDDN